MPKIKCRISEVVPAKKFKFNPILTHFQNAAISKENAASMDTCLAVDSDKGSGSKVALVVSNNNVYDGYIGQGFPTDLVKTYIGIRKKATNEIKLVEVSECNMLSYHYNTVAKQNKTHTGLTSDSARRLLFKDFGGKKALKVFERKEKMKVNVDVVKEQLDKTLMEINNQSEGNDDKFDLSKIEQDQQLEEMVPKMNKDATKLNDVYKIGELIEPDVLKGLDEDAVKLLKTPMKDLPLTRKYLVNAIEIIQRSKSPDDPDNLLRVKACIYVDALITFFTQINKVRHNQAIQLQPISTISPSLLASIKKKFAHSHISRTTKTNYVVHKTTCYIIVLSLLVSERYEMDIQDIVEEIGVSKTAINKLLATIAVRPKSKTNIISIRLPSQLRAFGTTFRKRRTL